MKVTGGIVGWQRVKRILVQKLMMWSWLRIAWIHVAILNIRSWRDMYLKKHHV